MLFVGLESIGIPIPGETMLIAASIYAGTTHDLGSPGWPPSLLPPMADRPNVGGNRLEVGLWQDHSSHRWHRARMLLGHS